MYIKTLVTLKAIAEIGINIKPKFLVASPVDVNHIEIFSNIIHQNFQKGFLFLGVSISSDFSLFNIQNEFFYKLYRKRNHKYIWTHPLSKYEQGVCR
jgi:hypothetical protein